MSEEFQDDQSFEKAYEEIMKLFDELSFSERMKRMMNGLGKPHDSGEYKFAKLQLQRLWGPAMAFVTPVLLIIFLMAFGGMSEPPPRAVVTEIITPEQPEELEEPPEPPDPPEFAEPVEMDFTVDVSINAPVAAVQSNQPMSPQPAAFDSVSIVKSPIVMRGIYGSRSPGARGQAIAGNGGSAAGEAAVMRALRWLKMKQKPDGSWGNNPTAFTGMALLSYLAHGETPASEEFGQTVEKGIRYLVDSQEPNGLFRRKDGNNYSHPIATYALCEAYTLTKVPMIKSAVEKAMTHIVQGQHPNGGWDYKMAQTDRDDTSYMGWCAQAVKAAKMAGDLNVPGLLEAYEKAPLGFKKNAAPSGGFGYTEPDFTGLTGVGILCMQLMGHANDAEVRNSLNVLDNAVYSWADYKNQPYTKRNTSPVYHWYYITQAKFHAGGDRWKNWNRMFLPEAVKQQQIQKAAIANPKGDMCDVGWWSSPSESESTGGDKEDIQNTCLTALQLMVYYRYLPTFKTPTVVDQDVVLNKDKEVSVKIDF